MPPKRPQHQPLGGPNFPTREAVLSNMNFMRSQPPAFLLDPSVNPFPVPPPSALEHYPLLPQDFHGAPNLEGSDYAPASAYDQGHDNVQDGPHPQDTLYPQETQRFAGATYHQGIQYPPDIQYPQEVQCFDHNARPQNIMTAQNNLYGQNNTYDPSTSTVPHIPYIQNTLNMQENPHGRYSVFNDNPSAQVVAYNHGNLYGQVENGPHHGAGLQQSQDNSRQEGDEVEEESEDTPPFVCDHPDCRGSKKTYKWLNSVIRHKKYTHENRGPSRCPECNVIRSRPDMIKKHRRDKHGAEYERPPKKRSNQQEKKRQYNNKKKKDGSSGQ